MLTEAITLQVESDVARFYNDAPQTDKQKLQALVGSWLKHYAEADVDSFWQSFTVSILWGWPGRGRGWRPA